MFEIADHQVGASASGMEGLVSKTMVGDQVGTAYVRRSVSMRNGRDLKASQNIHFLK